MRKGPVGKAHNFVVWVHRADLLTQLLHQLQRDSFAASGEPENGKQRPVDVVLDNDTRWLSQYYMIKRMLRLQPVYEEFIAKAKRLFRDARKGEGGQNLPPCLEESSFINESDWAVLGTFDEILSDFHVVVQAFEFLLGRLEDAKSRTERHPEPEQFCVNINLGWKKLDKYYNTLRDSPAYYAAAALHPSLRWDYFDEVWG
ncbi:hypothetical protein Forpi1262_v016983 [Fusarium oxysporum f. sp. raphani]|nr:hypothetical protein Forpi1262_v016983 [Fusarium oxysporum f. sp. raphani]